jgi:hypothetical protein
MTRIARSSALLLTLAALLTAPAAAGPDPQGAQLLPKSPAGDTAKAFIAMINDGSPEASKAFETSYRSPAQLAKVPLTERATRLASMHKEFGALTIQEVIDADANSLSLLARDSAGTPVVMEFVLDPKSGGKLDGVILSIGENARPQALTPEARKETVEAACRAHEENYVYPEVAARMADAARAKLKAGEYDAIKSESALARRLTEDFRAVSHDLHLRVNLSPKPPSESERQAMGGEDELARQNYMFKKVEILPGNIGYLRFDMFADSDGARKTAAAAMGFLAHCDAIVFDLRSNGGGSPEMIRFITSYLFDEPTHLNDMIDRTGKTVEEFWTLKEIPGERLSKGTPVYVLTSRTTFSGAEEFSYNLKNLKRATLIGQTTGGGAHPVQGVRISDRFTIGVPYMRANSPITKTNWEGKGVTPDIECPADAALDRAIAEATSTLASRKSAKR